MQDLSFSFVAISMRARTIQNLVNLFFVPYRHTIYKKIHAQLTYFVGDESSVQRDKRKCACENDCANEDEDDERRERDREEKQRDIERERQEQNTIFVQLICL